MTVAALSADGKIVRTAGQLDRALRVWDAATGQALGQIRTPPWQRFLAQSGDGKVLAAPRWDDRPVLVDPASAAVVWDGDMASERIEAMALNADGKLLAVLSGHRDRALRLWDTTRQRKSRRLGGRVDDCSALAFSQDGKDLAAAASLKRILFWDVATGEARQIVRQPRRRQDPFEDSILPRQSEPGTITLDPQARPSSAAAVALSASGRAVVASGFYRERWAAFDKPDAGLVRVYDLATGRERFQLADQEGVIAFSPDGKRLATAGHRDYAVYL